MNEAITEADALRRFPELQELVALKDAAWIFRISYDSQGELDCVMASHSVQQYTDALFIFDRHTISAARVLDDTYGGGCVWLKRGADLQEIVRELLDLPAPDEPGAPTLVKRSGLLWTP